MPARRKSPRRVLKRRSSGKARTSVTQRRSPKRTYKGTDTRLYGMQAESKPSFSVDGDKTLHYNYQIPNRTVRFIPSGGEILKVRNNNGTAAVGDQLGEFVPSRSEGSMEKRIPVTNVHELLKKLRTVEIVSETEREIAEGMRSDTLKSLQHELYNKTYTVFLKSHDVMFLGRMLGKSISYESLSRKEDGTRVDLQASLAPKVEGRVYDIGESIPELFFGLTAYVEAHPQRDKGDVNYLGALIEL